MKNYCIRCGGTTGKFYEELSGVCARCYHEAFPAQIQQPTPSPGQKWVYKTHYQRPYIKLDYEVNFIKPKIDFEPVTFTSDTWGKDAVVQALEKEAAELEKKKALAKLARAREDESIY